MQDYFVGGCSLVREYIFFNLDNSVSEEIFVSLLWPFFFF